MSNIPQTTPALATVTFHGHDLVTVMNEGQIFVALKPIIESLGLQWMAQLKRIKRDDVLSTCISMMDSQMPGDEQRRQIAFLPLKYLNGWLFGIDTARIKKPEVRAAIIQYKRECYDVLHAYWTQGEAINPRFRPDKTRVTLPGGLAIEQQDAIKALVKSRAEVLPKDKQGAATIRLWSSIKSKYGVSYKELPPEHFTAALSLVARVPLEGEHLPKPEAAPQPTCGDMLKAFGMFDAAQTFGSDPTTPLPDDIRAEVERKAWDMARQTYAIGVKFMTRGIAYTSEMGMPRSVEPGRAHTFLNQVSLEMITLPQSLETLRGLKAVAELMEESSASFRKKTCGLIENLTTRLGMAA